MKFNKELTKNLLFGMAYGDAIGVTTEFFKEKQIYELYKEYKDLGWPTLPVGRKQWGVKAGEHTDDTDMAWAIIRAYLEDKDLKFETIADKFVDWYNSNPKDIGNSTRIILAHIKQGKYNFGQEFYELNPDIAANGSLMRNGIINGFAEDLNEAFELSLLHGMITHYNPLAVICCAAQTWIINELINGRWPFKNVTTKWTLDFMADWIRWTWKSALAKKWRESINTYSLAKAAKTFIDAEFDHKKFNPFTENMEGRGGYCLLTLQIAVWALQWSRETNSVFFGPIVFPGSLFLKSNFDYLSVIPLIGYDSDTYAATAGPMFAACYNGVPENLSSCLQINEWWNKEVENNV